MHKMMSIEWSGMPHTYMFSYPLMCKEVGPDLSDSGWDQGSAVFNS